MALALDPQAQADIIIKAICSLEDDAAVKVITDTLTLRPEVAPIVVKNACPDLAFAPASSMTGRRSAGYVKGAAGPNGFAELENPELRLIFGKDVVVHREQLGDMQAGTAVNFAVLLNEESMPQAFDLQVGHAGASKPAPVNASHLAAAQLLQGGAGVAKARKDMVDADLSMGKGGGFGDSSGFQMDWMQKGKGDDKSGKGGKGKEMRALLPGKADIQQVLGQFRGTIKSFSVRDGFGFIECPDLVAQGFQNDVYLHHSQIGPCTPGDRVLFTAYLNRKGQPQSMEVKRVDEQGNEITGSVPGSDPQNQWGGKDSQNQWGGKDAHSPNQWGGKDSQNQWGGKDAWGGKDPQNQWGGGDPQNQWNQPGWNKGQWN